MTGFGILSLIAGALQLTVPSYALRLVRLFGTRSVGWFLVAAFSSLALVHLLKPLTTLGAGPAPGLSVELVCALASMLLLIGMGHMEILLSERQHAQREEQRRRLDWERQAREQTGDLAKANQELLQELATRAQEHQTLKDSEAQYRFLFLEHPQPMWIFDLRSLRFLAVNRAALRSCGFSAPEFLALTARELLPGEVVPAFLQDAAKPCSTATSRGRWPLRKKDQTLVQVEMLALDLRYDQCPARLILATEVSPRQPCEPDSHPAGISAPVAVPSVRAPIGVLLVQADERARGLARHILGRQGYRVIEVDNGSTALALWEGQAPNVDLLLTDLVLPGECSGPDLASHLRQTKPHLKVLFSCDSTDGQPLSGATADPLVSKPYNSDMLLQAVQCCIARNA